MTYYYTHRSEHISVLTRKVSPFSRWQLIPVSVQRIKNYGVFSLKWDIYITALCQGSEMELHKRGGKKFASFDKEATLFRQGRMDAHINSQRL